MNEVLKKSIKKDINFCISQKGELRKIFKIIFQKNKPDFYIALPHFNASQYQIGKIIIPAGQQSLPPFNVSENKTAQTVVPVKFSYHIDGKVHFKPINPFEALVSFAHKYESIQATPIQDFSGEHFFTITFEGLEKFDILNQEKNKSSNFNVISQIPDNFQTFKITAYAGFSEESVKGKYGSLEPAIITLTRPQLKLQLYIAFYTLAGEKSIQNGSDIKPFIVVLAGFKKIHTNLLNDLSTLYLYAK